MYKMSVEKELKRKESVRKGVKCCMEQKKGCNKKSKRKKRVYNGEERECAKKQRSECGGRRKCEGAEEGGNMISEWNLCVCVCIVVNLYINMRIYVWSISLI